LTGSVTDLSQNAKDICKEHYGKKCGDCPLRPACCGIRDLYGRDKLNRFCTKINELADRLKGAAAIEKQI